MHSTYIPSDFVAELLAGDDGNLLTYSLVDVEVKGEPGVILFNDDTGCLLHSLGPNATLYATK